MWIIVFGCCIRFQTLSILVILGSFLYVEEVLVRHKLFYRILRDILYWFKVAYLHHFMIFSIWIVHFIGFFFLSCDSQHRLPLMLSQHHFKIFDVSFGWGYWFCLFPFWWIFMMVTMRMVALVEIAVWFLLFITLGQWLLVQLVFKTGWLIGRIA